MDFYHYASMDLFHILVNPNSGKWNTVALKQVIISWLCTRINCKYKFSPEFSSSFSFFFLNLVYLQIKDKMYIVDFMFHCWGK